VTILCRETLLNVLDLIADGVTVVETTAAIGAAPGSKIIFAWIADSEAAGEFDPPPSPESKWCVDWRGSLDWFHWHYKTAQADGRVARTIRRTPIRAELENRLRTKRGEEPKPPGYSPPRVQVFKPSDEPANPVTRDLPAPPPPRPSYAYKSRPLDASNVEPPQEGRFSVVADRPKTKGERRAGTVEITDLGIRRW
jgi:hypothetical protein